MIPETYWAEWWATDHNLDVPVPDIERAIARHEDNAADAAYASGRDCDRAAWRHYGTGGWPC